jgi:hypothetical protein
MTYLQRFKPTDDDFEACTHVVNDRPIIGVNAKNNKARVLAITGSQGAADEHESIGNAFSSRKRARCFISAANHHAQCLRITPQCWLCLTLCMR